MTIRHHLTDDLLMGYAAGALPEAFSLVVATHISMCDICRAQLASFEAVGGAVMTSTDRVEMSDGALQMAMARLTQQDARPVPRKPSLFPAPLAEYVGGGLDSVKWAPLGMGVRQAILPTSKGATARLLYIPAGQSVPDHGHRGTELTLVLQGAFRDETDRFGRGDVEVASEDLEHQPKAEAGMDCICLAATDASLRFSGFMPRLLQPFFRI